jgi:hypothetical protein
LLSQHFLGRCSFRFSAGVATLSRIVATKNSERAGKARVLVEAAVVSSGMLKFERSIVSVVAVDSVVGRLWNAIPQVGGLHHRYERLAA